VRTLRKISNKKVFTSLKKEIDRRRILNKQCDGLDLLCNKIRKNDKLVLKRKFFQWMGPERRFRKISVMDHLSSVFRVYFNIFNNLNNFRPLLELIL
jgi:hypothetical protein